MEIDYESNLKDNNSNYSENIFKLDYKGQSLKSNLIFDSWKNKMLLKYGRDAKLFKCKEENLYFYTSYQEYKEFYIGKCPSCDEPKCYFCFNGSSDDCCVIKITYYTFFFDAKKFIKQINYNYCIEFLKFLIPIYSIFLSIGIITKNYYYILSRKYDRTKFYFIDNGIYWTAVIINGLTAFLLSITYIFYDIYFKIFLLFISIFFKCKPIKYYIGFIKAGMEDVTIF